MALVSSHDEIGLVLRVGKFSKMLRPDPANLLFRIVLVLREPQLALLSNHVEYLVMISTVRLRILGLVLTSPAWYTRYGYPASCFVVAMLNSNSDAANHKTLYPSAGTLSLDEALDARWLSSGVSDIGMAEWKRPEYREPSCGG